MPTDKPMMMIRNIPPELRLRYRALCVESGVSMAEDLRAYMARAVESRVLAAKERRSG